VLFRKRQRPPTEPHRTSPVGPSKNRSGFYPIEFEMMTKGAVIRRKGKLYRQYGVTVHGATRLVTSGDVVDQPTYDALVAAGAIRVAPPEPFVPEPNPAASLASAVPDPNRPPAD